MMARAGSGMRLAIRWRAALSALSPLDPQEENDVKNEWSEDNVHRDDPYCVPRGPDQLLRIVAPKRTNPSRCSESREEHNVCEFRTQTSPWAHRVADQDLKAKRHLQAESADKQEHEVHHSVRFIKGCGKDRFWRLSKLW
jgi:hypothetical protein